MSERFFQSPAGSNPLRLSPGTQLECKICWHVYDPAEGDAVSQIPPGTAFSDLPDYWTCPECGTGKQDFLIVDA